MKLLFKAKDGGEQSTVTGYWLIEWKRAFSVVLLRFDGASREAYHNHAFNSVSWVLRGLLHEEFLDGKGHPLPASLKWVYTSRRAFHKVSSVGRSWVLSFRGPWSKTWQEFIPKRQVLITLTDGRVQTDIVGLT